MSANLDVMEILRRVLAGEVEVNAASLNFGRVDCANPVVLGVLAEHPQLRMLWSEQHRVEEIYRQADSTHDEMHKRGVSPDDPEHKLVHTKMMLSEKVYKLLTEVFWAAVMAKFGVAATGALSINEKGEIIQIPFEGNEEFFMRTSLADFLTSILPG